MFHVGLQLPDGLVCALENSSAAPVDVVWCNTTAALRAAKQGWCESLQRLEVLSELRDRARLQAYPEWPVAQVYVVQHVLVYRTCLYPGTAPQTWRALFDPRHAGRVVLSPGGNGFYPVAQVLGGGQPKRIPMDLSPCWSTVAKLRPQLRQPDYNIGLEAPIAQGQIDLCCSALPDALAFRASGLDVDWAVPHEGVADTTDAFGYRVDGRLTSRSGLGSTSLSRCRTLSRNIGAPCWGAANARARRCPQSCVRDQTFPVMPTIVRVLFVPEHVKARYAPAWEGLSMPSYPARKRPDFTQRAVLSIKHTGAERRPNRDAAASPRFSYARASDRFRRAQTGRALESFSNYVFDHAPAAVQEAVLMSMPAMPLCRSGERRSGALPGRHATTR